MYAFSSRQCESSVHSFLIFNWITHLKVKWPVDWLINFIAATGQNFISPLKFDHFIQKYRVVHSTCIYTSVNFIGQGKCLKCEIKVPSIADWRNRIFDTNEVHCIQIWINSMFTLFTRLFNQLIHKVPTFFSLFNEFGWVIGKGFRRSMVHALENIAIMHKYLHDERRMRSKFQFLQQLFIIEMQ